MFEIIIGRISEGINGRTFIENVKEFHKKFSIKFLKHSLDMLKKGDFLKLSMLQFSKYSMEDCSKEFLDKCCAGGISIGTFDENTGWISKIISGKIKLQRNFRKKIGEGIADRTWEDFLNAFHWCFFLKKSMEDYLKA